MPGNPPQIFLGHANEDKAQVRQLYAKLQEAGYKPWLDEEDLLPGQNWRDEIPKALKNSDMFIACLSSTSISKRGYIQREFKMAMEMLAEVPPGEIYLIPLKFDDCPISELRQIEYGLNLRDIQWLDYWKPNGFDKLLKAIESKFRNQKISMNQFSNSDSQSLSEEQSALDIWKEKLNDFQKQEAIASDPGVKFQLKKQIEECLQKIRELSHKSNTFRKDSLKTYLPLEIPEGRVPLDSLFYVERPPIESDCYETILRPGSLIRVKAPRQMGKSSLMARILFSVKQADYKTASLNFHLVDDDCLKNLDQFLQWFCASISDELKLAFSLEEHWKGILGSKKYCTNYFQRYLLSQLEKPLALGLDEVDKVFQYPEIASGFFGLLRAWHERGKDDCLWGKLRLVIVHSQEVYIPLDINQSPFNVGFSVELSEFTTSQVEDLAKKHGWHCSVQEREELIEMCGGHPYLIRVALYEIGRRRKSLKQLLSVAPTEEGMYQNHLRRHLLTLKQDPSLWKAFKDVIAASEPLQIDSVKSFKLKSMGLVKFKGNKVMPLCELYRQYFSNRLGD